MNLTHLEAYLDGQIKSLDNAEINDDADSISSCQSNRVGTLSSIRMNQTFTRFLRNVSSKRKQRKLFVMAMHHVYSFKLRNALSILKKPFSPQIIEVENIKLCNARNWYKKRLLLISFGGWVRFRNEEVTRDNQLMQIGNGFYLTKRVRNCIINWRRKRYYNYVMWRNSQLGEAYYNWLRLIEMFAVLRHQGKIINQRKHRNVNLLKIASDFRHSSLVNQAIGNDVSDVFIICNSLL